MKCKKYTWFENKDGLDFVVVSLVMYICYKGEGDKNGNNYIHTHKTW